MRIFLCCALLLGSGLFSSASSSHKHRHSTRAGSSGAFDFYLFALSWSPEFCQSHGSNPQCSKPYGFIVHGLWPEYTGGGGPENCSQAPGLSDPSKFLDIMPDPNLIAHEWLTHGTCSGLSADSYFALIRKAYNSIRIPDTLKAPSQQLTTSPAQISQQFSQANSNLPANAVDVTCQSYYLNSVEICLDKNLTAMSCPMPSPCRASSIKVPPVTH